MKYCPPADLLEILEGQGIEGREFELEDAEVDRCRRWFRDVHPNETPEQLDFRVGYFLIWQNFFAPNEKSVAVKSADALNARRLLVIHESAREARKQSLPELRKLVIESNQIGRDQLVRQDDALSKLDTAQAHLKEARGTLGCALGEIENVKQHHSTQVASVQDALKRAAKKILWGIGIAAALVILAVIASTVFSLKAHAQLDGVQVQNSGGTSIKQWMGGIAKLKCGANMTCTLLGSTVTLASSASAGSVAWDSILDPASAALALSMGNFNTTFTFGSATGAGTSMFILRDTTGNTGTGYVLLANTVGTSVAKPIGFFAKGTSNGVEMTAAAILQAAGTGQVRATHIGTTLANNNESLGKIPIGQGDGSFTWSDPLVQGLTAHDAVGTSTNPVAIGGYASAAAPANVSADGDIVRTWHLLNGSPVVNLATAGTLYDARSIRALTSGDTVTVVQGTGTNLHTVCDSGCSGGSFADNAAFSFGITVVSPIAGVLDDVATNAATENSAAAVRITSDRMLYSNLGKVGGTATDTNSGNKSAGTLRVVLATDQPALTNKLLVTPDSVALPANQSVNVSQINAVTPLMGNGVTGTGSQRVTIASDNTAFAVNNTQQGTASQNVAQLAGTTTDTNSGVKSAGTLRVVLATDQPALTNKLLVTPDSVALPANQSVNVAQVNGVTTQTGTGTAGTGTQRVAVASDSSMTGTLANDGAAAGTNRFGTLPCVAQTSYRAGTAATVGRNEAADCGTDGLLWTAQLPAIRPASYSASATVTTAASATDIAVLPGNASNTVLVTKVKVSCTQTTAGIILLQIIKRSTADSGGTSAGMTEVPDDSNYAAASSAALTYTANPTINATVGNVDTYKLGCLAAGTAAANDIYILNRTQKPIVLRGTAEQLAINLNGVTVTGGSVALTYEWIETATITP